MKRILPVFAAFTLTAHAQLILETSGGNDLNIGPGTGGFEFTVNASETIRSLGVFDADLATPGLYSAHTVGLWDGVTHALLGSVTVPAQGATAIGAFWYAALSTPITLAAGHVYVLGASYADNDFDFARGNVASVTTDPRITLHDAMLSSGVGFEFPDLTVGGANFGFFGPNALEAAVPEPQMASLAAALLLALFALVNTARAKEPSVRSVLDSKPAERQRLFATIAKRHPAALKTLAPAVNRPPITPGNEHGNRPTVPPGLRNYGTP